MIYALTVQIEQWAKMKTKRAERKPRHFSKIKYLNVILKYMQRL